MATIKKSRHIDQYKIFKVGEKIYAKTSQLLGVFNLSLPPMQVVFELTYRCNLKCEFCYQRREEEQLGVKYQRDELSLEEVKMIIDQTLPWTLIIFSGGEIFIRKDCMDILSYAAKKRRCHIVTNATYITPELSEKLISIGLTSVGISIEGKEEVQNRVRGSETFLKVTNTIRYLVEEKKKQEKTFPLINLKTTITAGNVDHLTEIVDLAEELEANYVSFQIMNTSIMISGMYLYDSLEPYQEKTPLIEDFPLRTLKDQLVLLDKKASQSKVKIRFSPDLTHAQIMDHYANKTNISDYSCATPWTGMNISPTGDVFPCFNYRIGNLRSHKLLKLWNNKKYLDFRRSLLRNGQFAGCQGCCDLIAKPDHP